VHGLLFKGQYVKDELKRKTSYVSNVCNFTPQTKPSLLTFNEVTTLFHEFGHGLHGMLANTTYLSGTRYIGILSNYQVK
jgi:peptidyl-dipeptidase Dcp